MSISSQNQPLIVNESIQIPADNAKKIYIALDYANPSQSIIQSMRSNKYQAFREPLQILADKISSARANKIIDCERTVKFTLIAFFSLATAIFLASVAAVSSKGLCVLASQIFLSWLMYRMFIQGLIDEKAGNQDVISQILTDINTKEGSERRIATKIYEGTNYMEVQLLELNEINTSNPQAYENA